MTASEQTEQDLLSSWERSASAVRHSFRCFETEYIRPATNKLLVESKHHPIRFTFLAIFFALSSLPVLSFLGFSLFVFASCISMGLAGALFAATLTVLLFGSLLVGMLAMLFCASIFLTGCATGIYLALRFAIRIRNDGARTGAVEWAHETREHFLPSVPVPKARASDEDLTDQSSQTIVVGSVPLTSIPPQDQTKHDDEGDHPGGDMDSAAKEEAE